MWKTIGSSRTSDQQVVAPPKRKSANVPPRHTRNARACTGCKKVKSKCEELLSAEGASCRRCQRLNLECVFTDAPAHRRNPTGGVTAAPLTAVPGTGTAEVLGASKKRRGVDEMGGTTSSVAGGSSTLVTTAASTAVLMKDWNVSEFRNDTSRMNHPSEPKPMSRFHQTETRTSTTGQDSDLALAMESKCNIAAGGACEVGRAKPIEAASLPPAVAAFIAFEEARSDLSKPVIFMRNSFNSDVYFMVNETFEDRVASIEHFTPPMPGTCPYLQTGIFAVEDMESMFEYVDSSSRGLKAPPPSGGNIERSVKLDLPNPVRIRVRPPGMEPPGATEPLCPYVPCHVAVQVVVTIGPSLEAVHVAFVARPVYEVGEHRSWFPAWALAPAAALDSAAVAVTALMDNFSPIASSGPTSIPRSEVESIAPFETSNIRDEYKLFNQIPCERKSTDSLTGNYGQFNSQADEQSDCEFYFDDAADVTGSLMDDGFESLLDGTSVLAPFEDSATDDAVCEACTTNL